jgi:predicted ATPase
VARNARDSSLLILGTLCPEELAVTDGKEHPLIDTMQLMNREDLHKRIELKRLSKESMDELLGSLLGRTEFTDEFKDRIFKETEGNPLFVIQLIKFLFEEKIIQNESGIWKLTINLEDIDVPPRIYIVIEQRLNRVEEDYRKILDYASVIGETFSSSILVSALKMEKVKLLEKLRKLEHKHRLIHFQ